MIQKWLMIPKWNKRKLHLSIFLSAAFLLCFSSCSDDDAARPIDSQSQEPYFIRAVDISSWPEISEANLTFFNQDSLQVAFLDQLQASGVNTLRLRLWHSPEGRHCALAEVDSFARIAKARGFKIWLCLHLSDTWADPGHQIKPQAWSSLDYPNLKDSLYNYVKHVSAKLDPEILQIGNEINPGILSPEGNRFEQPEQFKELLDTALRAARSVDPQMKLMLHYAGHQNALNFYKGLKGLDYDMIGLSYYPIWHGKSLDTLERNLISLSQRLSKEIVIAETAYPFSLGWADWTNNIVGLEEQLIDTYPASPQGQKKFMADLRQLLESIHGGRGFCYWGAERIAWKGPQAKDASAWENQALFDFNRQALPVQMVFNP